VRDEGAYGCAVPRAYANRNPGLPETYKVSRSTCKHLFKHQTPIEPSKRTESHVGKDTWSWLSKVQWQEDMGAAVMEH